MTNLWLMYWVNVHMMDYLRDGDSPPGKPRTEGEITSAEPAHTAKPIVRPEARPVPGLLRRRKTAAVKFSR
jgi:hypothetical protein